MTSEFAIEMFYDGDCPLCLRETNFIRRLDRNRRVCFTNIASPDFDPSSTGKAYHELMAEIHGRLTDGRWVTGVEVFRRLYSAVSRRPRSAGSTDSFAIDSTVVECRLPRLRKKSITTDRTL